MIRLSDEQHRIIGVASLGSSLAARAFAGAAKTSTCVEVAKVCPDALYLAFNRAAADDAQRRFPMTTKVKIAHALAFASEGRYFRARLVTSLLDLRRGYAPLMQSEIARCFGVTTPQDAATIAHVAFDTVHAFLASADQRVSPLRHVAEGPHDAELVAEIATSIVNAMLDRNGTLPVTHDTYLKAFQLSRPMVRAKTIIFDEAQDASEAMLDIVLRQAAQQVFVGDQWQAIYAWRGAVNAFSHLAHLDAFPLSRCWRFGPEVAAVANALLGALGETTPLIGAGAYNTVVRYTDAMPSDPPVAGTRALLGRSTLGVFGLALGAAQEGARLAFIGGHERILGWFRAAYELATVGHTRHPAFATFRSYRDLKVFSAFAAGAQYAPSVRAVETYKDDLPYCIDEIRARLVPEKDADTLASTIHQYKGREAPTVVLADDVGIFASFKSVNRQLFAQFLPEEANIAYVGITRAQEFLAYDRAKPNVDASIRAVADMKALAALLRPDVHAESIFDAAAALAGVPIPDDLLASVQRQRRNDAALDSGIRSTRAMR